MKRLLPNLTFLAAHLAIAVVVSGAARAAELSEPVILVASSPLNDTSFEQAVVFVTPLADGSHGWRGTAASAADVQRRHDEPSLAIAND